MDREVGDVGLPLEATAMTADETHLYLIAQGTLVRIAKPSGAPETIASGALVNGTRGIAVDDTYVYWTDLGHQADNGSIRRAPKSGGPAQVLVGGRARPIAIAADGERLYWTEDNALAHEEGRRDGNVVAMPRNQVEPVVLSHDVKPDRIAVVGQDVYWTTSADGGPTAKLRRMAKNGGEPETLVDGRSNIYRFSVDATDGRQAAWAESPWCSNCGGVFVRRATGEIEELATTFVAAGVATSGGDVYFGRYTDRGVRGGAVFARAVGGGGGASPRELRNALFPTNATPWVAGDLVVDASRVYWFDYWWSYSGSRETVVRSAPR